MKLKRVIIIFLLVFGLTKVSFSQKQKNLNKETMLHPGDAFTAYVFKKGEWAYNQAITPYPSWAWWGITDWVTAEIDIEAWLGGVPSFNFRFGLAQQKDWRPAIAYETMYQFLKNKRDQFYNLDFLEINRHGSNWYNHINMSWNINNNINIHLAGGFTYSDDLSISNGDSLNYIGKSFTNNINPDISIGTDLRAKEWLSFHSTLSYGSTFLYADNIARKNQFTLGARLAPFLNSKAGFLNCLRIEITYLYNNYKDAKESFQGPIGFIYWQWDWSKEKRK